MEEQLKTDTEPTISEDYWKLEKAKVFKDNDYLINMIVDTVLTAYGMEISISQASDIILIYTKTKMDFYDIMRSYIAVLQEKEIKNERIKDMFRKAYYVAGIKDGLIKQENRVFLGLEKPLLADTYYQSCYLFPQFLIPVEDVWLDDNKDYYVVKVFNKPDNTKFNLRRNLSIKKLRRRF